MGKGERDVDACVGWGWEEGEVVDLVAEFAGEAEEWGGREGEGLL